MRLLREVADEQSRTGTRSSCQNPKELRRSPPDSDYASTYAVVINGKDDRSAEQWARETFEGAPAVIRWLVVAGCRYVPGLNLGPRPSSDHVLGWKVASRSKDSIVLDVRSRMLTARQVVRSTHRESP